MSTPTPSALPQLLAEADRLLQQGQMEAASRLFQRILEQVPDESHALNFMAMRAYGAGDLEGARNWCERAAKGQPRLALCHANLGQILQALNDIEGAIAAFEAALALDPDFVPVRLDAGRLHEQAGRQEKANSHYRLALSKLPPPERLPAPLREKAVHAQRALDREEKALADFLASRLTPLRRKQPAGSGDRFDECYDILMGHSKPQLPKPGFMYFPKLPPLTFYPHELFPWASRVEAVSERIREELLGAMSRQDEHFVPYVQKSAEEAGPGSAWAPLNRNRDWGVYFLFNQGERVESHCTACPETTSLLESLPLVRIPGRGPTAFFSRLQADTHIPPHHGATNTRLIAHLPLIVPPDCAIRVGNDVRPWRPGELLIFDDTIEHEAWNRSDEVRVVLIFDVWNPYLSEEERELVTEVTAAMAEFFPGRQHELDF